MALSITEVNIITRKCYTLSITTLSITPLNITV
jgi:hypothetical protein